MTWDKQVGGDHYRKVPGEQHWDRVYRLFGPGYFIGCATKYAERYQSKNGKEDLEKAVHFLQKLISLEYPDTEVKIKDGQVTIRAVTPETISDATIYPQPSRATPTNSKEEPGQSGPGQT